MSFPTPLAKRIRVLLVDDSSDDRFLVSEFCKGFSFPVDYQAYHSLAEAENRGADQEFDVILLDLDLGPTLGMGTLLKAKQIFPGKPIVLLTGNDAEDLMLDCLKSGAQDFLVKGRYNTQELEKAIRFSILRQTRFHELENKTEELDFMLDTQEIGLFVLDGKGRVSHCNQAVCDILEIKARQLVGKIGVRLVPLPEDGSHEVIYCTVSGVRKQLEVRATQSGWRGRVDRFVTVIDVTDRKEMERRASEGDKLETVARVCFGVAHEFNNLLALTRTKTDFLETLCDVDPVWAAHVEDLQVACERGSGLVKQLMTFYGGEDSVKQQGKEYLEVGAFLRTWEPHWESMLGVECSLELILDEHSCYIQISESTLNKVLSGLISNARDALNGKGRIRIRTTRRLAEGKEGDWCDYAVISVLDDGCGIAKADQRRIFEPFFTTKETKAGRGLGLSVVNNLLRENGGEIDFDSKEDWGTEFRVALPTVEPSVVEASPAATVDVSEEVPVEAVDGSSTTVLVADDEPIIRFSVARLLEAEGCEVHCAENAEEALSYLSDLSRPCHVLLTDINMPGIDGVELANRAVYLREEIQIVVMSGYGPNAVKESWMKAKSARFLSKPFKRADLCRVVLLEKHVSA